MLQKQSQRISTTEKGRRAEAAATLFLQRQGLNLLTKNFRCKAGELDLIMLDKGTLVFVEVRMRSSMHWGGPAASINRRKQAKLIRAAQVYRRENPHLASNPCRFDAICIVSDVTDQSEPTWIKSAFDSSDRYS